SSLCEKGGQMLVGILVRSARNSKGVVVVQHAKVGPSFPPQIVGFGRMNMRIGSVGSRQYVVVGRRVGDVFTDVLHVAIYERNRRAVHKTVNERSVRILKNLLNSPRDARRLCPVVILHRDYEYVFDSPVILGSYAPTTHSSQECEHS